MQMPCSNIVPCWPCYVSPLANLTAEAADGEVFIGQSWTDPTGTPFTPQIGTRWTATGCLGICESTISQDAANLCASNQVSQCEGGNNPDTPLVTNDPQSCTVLCPDGSPFTFTVPAGLVFLFSKTEANAQAYQIACQRARQYRICFGNLTRCTCINAQYSSTVHVTGGQGTLTYTLHSGSLPTGLSLNSTSGGFVISGTPTVNGTYDFVVQGVDSVGNYMRKSYTIVVLEITTTTLPAYTIGVPYSYQLQAAGGSGNYSFKITNGSLPAGLTMSVTGLISGTPT